jgi:hypothetical protein
MTKFFMAGHQCGNCFMSPLCRRVLKWLLDFWTMFVDPCILLTVINERELHCESRKGINKTKIKYCYWLAVVLHFMVCFE